MGRYLNRLYSMMVAMVSSYVVNMVYQINSAFAMTTVYGSTYQSSSGCAEIFGRTFGMVWRCSMGGGKTVATLDIPDADAGTVFRENEAWFADAYTNGAYPCDVSKAESYITSASLAAYMAVARSEGYWPMGCSAYYFDSNGSHSSAPQPWGSDTISRARTVSVDVVCYFNSAHSIVTPNYSEDGRCGSNYYCRSGSGFSNMYFVSASCFESGGKAGYLGSNSWCTCCPGVGTADSNVPYQRRDSNVAPSVFSVYDASAASQCYMTGKFKDDSGLFEFTDSNKCYYAS